MRLINSLLNILLSPFRWFWKTKLRNKLIVILAVAIVATILVYQNNKKNNQPQYTTQTVSRRTITALVSETGNVSNNGSVQIYSTSTGIIENTFVKDGDLVKIDQPLFKIRSTATEQEKSAAYANYLTSKSAFNTAQQTKPTTQSQLEIARKAVLDSQVAVNALEERLGASQDNPATHQKYTQNEIDSIRSSLTSARQNFKATEQKYLDSDSTIQSSQASINSAWLAYQATQNVTVKATTSGTIANLSASEGDKVIANSSAITTTSSSPVLTIISTTKQVIKLPLNEVDISKVELGQTADITLDAFSNQKFTGQVSQIDDIGSNNQGVITYNVNVVFDNSNPIIKQGMTANVDIQVSKASNVLAVPNSAIKPYQGKKAVQVLDQKTNLPKYQPVEVGIKSPEYTEIKSGVDEGSSIIIATKK